MNKNFFYILNICASIIFSAPLHGMLKTHNQELEVKTKHDHALSDTVQENNITWISAHSQRTYPFMGLVNSDNRCYLNASLQSLFSSPCFQIFIDYQNYTKNSVGAALQKIYTQYYSQCTGVITSDIVKQALAQLHNEGNFHINVAQDRQEDAAEVLSKVLEVITPDLQHPQKNPFCIQEITEFRCRECGEIYEKELDEYKFSTILTVPITRYTLSGCIDEYFLGLAEKRCCKPHNTSHSKKSKLNKSPDILCIALNRFSYTNDGGCKKNNEFVSVPNNLDMRAYTEQEDLGAIYDLNACIMHHGHDISHGHYVAYIKRGSHWYLCNDTGITQMPRSFNINKDLVQAENEVAYILFYEKRDAARGLDRMQKENPKPINKNPENLAPSYYASCKAFFFGSSQRTLLSLGFVGIVCIILQKVFAKK